MIPHPPPTTLDYAIQLAHSLAERDQRAAYVVDDHGHLMLASAPDISTDRLHYWTPDQVVYTVSPPFDDPLPDPGPGGPDVPGDERP